MNASVVCVDPEIAVPGDGATPETALAELPAPDALAADTRYFIRRTATPLVWGTGAGDTNVDLPNIYWLGMPKPGDWLWESTPEALREAWGGDAINHATLQFGGPSMSVRFRHASGHGGVHRLKFLVPHQSGTSRDGIGFLCWTNANHSASSYEQQYDKAVFMTDCEWRVDGVPLDDPLFDGDCLETINSWFSMHFCRNIAVRGCKFVYPGKKDYGNYYSHTPFYFDTSQRAVVTGNDFWIGSYDVNYGQPHLCRFYHVADVTFADNRNRYVVQQKAGKDAYLRGWFSITGNNHTRRIERVSSRIERFHDPANKPQRLCLHGEVIRCETNPTHIGWDRTHNKPFVRDADIDVDTSPCWESHDGNYNPDSPSGPSVVHLGTNNHDGAVRTQYAEGYARDIRAVVPKEDGIGRANIPWALYLDRPPVHHTGDTLRNIKAKNFRGGALYINGGASSNNEGGTGQPPLELGTLEGGVRFHNLAFVTVDKLEVGRPEKFLHVEGCTAYFKKIVADASAWNNHLVIQNANSSRLVIDKINVPVLWPALTSYGRTGIIVNSDGGVEGRWKGRNEYYYGENWNARREGGGLSSLKLWGTTNARLPLQVGFAGFRNFRVTAPAPGRYLLKVHGAHKMFPEPDVAFLSRRVVVKAVAGAVVGTDAANDPVIKPVEYDSQTCGWWEPDAEAIWHNDDGVEPVVCVIPLELPDTGDLADLSVDVRLEYDWDNPQGYFYLDPLPELEA